MKKILLILSLVLVFFLLSGCSMIEGFLSPNKLAGNWYGAEQGSGGMTAHLNLGTADNFRAEFGNGESQYTANGSYSYTPQQSWLFSKNEVGAVIFNWDGNIVACEYAVTSSSLMLWGWRDDEGNVRNLTLFR